MSKDERFAAKNATDSVESGDEPGAWMSDALTIEDLRDLCRQNHELAQERLEEVSFMEEEVRRSEQIAAQLLEHSKVASERLLEIGRLKVELENVKADLEEQRQVKDKTAVPEGDLSVQSLLDQLRMRDSIITCLQQELATTQSKLTQEQAKTRALGGGGQRKPKSHPPIEKALNAAFERTQKTQENYDRLMEEEERRVAAIQ
mmetsp:Transcript_901/g.2403  ORF Transcript_901/g.2403 Transcript_901/m.2403 type:complete len:203 (+) Transcript_901:107-715(+)